MRNSGVAVLALVLLTASTALVVAQQAPAQENLPIRNLGAGEFLLDGNRLVYSAEERFVGEDLNGDLDLDDWVVHSRDLSTGVTTNLGLPGGFLDAWGLTGFLALSGDTLAFAVSEGDRDEDLNDDDDVEDFVIHLRDLSTGETTNLGFAVDRWNAALSRNWLVFCVSEEGQFEDLNGDGDYWDMVLHMYDLATGEVTNLDRAIDAGTVGLWLSERWIAFGVLESAQAEDLNGDGDFFDTVLHTYDLHSGELTNLKLASPPTSRKGPSNVKLTEEVLAFTVSKPAGDVLYTHDLDTGETTSLELPVGSFSLSEDWLAFDVSESQHGVDLNGDGDFEDHVLHARDLVRRETTNLGLVHSPPWGGLLMFETRIAFWVPEEERSEDLNRDGDTADHVLHVHDLARDETVNLGATAVASGVGRWPNMLLAFSEKWLVFGAGLVHVHDLQTGETTDVGLGLWDGSPGIPRWRRGDWAGLSGDWLVVRYRHYHLVDLARVFSLPRFIRGDANGDGDSNITDAVGVLDHLFGGGDAPPCAKSADANDSGTVDLTDPVFLLNFLFTGGAPPPAPFPECGPDPTADDLTCVSFEACQ